jgi:hypothetical protein
VTLEGREDRVELGLVGVLAHVEFDYPTLEDGDEV